MRCDDQVYDYHQTCIAYPSAQPWIEGQQVRQYLDACYGSARLAEQQMQGQAAVERYGRSLLHTGMLVL